MKYTKEGAIYIFKTLKKVPCSKEEKSIYDVDYKNVETDEGKRVNIVKSLIDKNRSMFVNIYIDEKGFCVKQESYTNFEMAAKNAHNYCNKPNIITN